jgi:hypothetical protein
MSTAVAGKVLLGVEVARNDQVDIVRRHSGIAECGPRSDFTERGGRLVVCRDMALANAGALGDPLVRGFDHALEIGILHDAARQRQPHAAHH